MRTVLLEKGGHHMKKLKLYFDYVIEFYSNYFKYLYYL